MKQTYPERKEVSESAFRPGAWGADPKDPMTLARFILRPTNDRCAEQIATLLEMLVDWRNCWLCPATDFDRQAARLVAATDDLIEQVPA